MGRWPLWFKVILGLGGLIVALIVFLGRTAVPPTSTRPPPSATAVAATATPLSPTATEVAPTPLPELASPPKAEAGYPQPPARGLSSARVTGVLDGDTAEVLAGTQVQTVRLIGIDSPEVGGDSPVQCFGREASAKARELLDGQTVSLESDPTQGDLDQYRRALRYIWLADGRLFNLEMIREGYATEYTFNLPYKYQEVFKRAQARAREQSRGLWSPDTCTGDTAKPADPPAPARAQPGPKPGLLTPTQQAAQKPAAGGRARPIGADCPQSHPIKGNQGSRSTTEWIYHLPGGGSYVATVPEECFATEADAQAAGYRRARN